MHSFKKGMIKYVGPVVIYKIIDPHNYLLITLDGKILRALFKHERLKLVNIKQIMEISNSCTINTSYKCRKKFRKLNKIMHLLIKKISAFTSNKWEYIHIYIYLFVQNFGLIIQPDILWQCLHFLNPDSLWTLRRVINSFVQKLLQKRLIDQ